MRRIAVINQKGGVGKTTTAANLGVALSRRGHSVLLIDLDPQSHLSLHLGIDVQEDQPNIYDVLVSGRTVTDVRREIGGGLWMLPAHRELYHAESELVSVIGRETILSDALASHGDGYDFLLIDCPPSLGILSLNGLCAAGEVLIPMQAHFLSLQGVGKLLETIQLVHSRINPKLRVGGVLLCMYDCGTRLSGEVLQDLKSFFADNRNADTPWSAAKIYHTVIRRNIKLAESPSHGLSVLDYAPNSHGAIDYMRLAGEVLDEQGALAGQPLDAVAHLAGLNLTGTSDVAETTSSPPPSAREDHQPMDQSLPPALPPARADLPPLRQMPLQATG
jgi:chromosome partitioning protein